MTNGTQLLMVEQAEMWEGCMKAAVGLGELTLAARAGERAMFWRHQANEPEYDPLAVLHAFNARFGDGSEIMDKVREIAARHRGKPLPPGHPDYRP